MDCKLIIPKKQHNKYHYFLTRFKKLEWSGPAWYETKLDEDGMVVEWKLVHFHPLNLGGHAATEWEAKDLAKILRLTYRKFPKLRKAYIGLIHSHNTMGAFLSGTDESTMMDMAPDENFYGSLVVASSGKELEAFGFSWKDQYKCIHVHTIESNEIIIENLVKTNEEWVSIADKIEKEKPVTTAVSSYMPKGLNNGFNSMQTNLLQTEYEGAITFDKTASNHIEKVMKKLTKKNQNKLADYLRQLELGTLSEVDFEVKAEAIGIDVMDIIKLSTHGTISIQGNGYGGVNVYGEY